MGRHSRKRSNSPRRSQSPRHKERRKKSPSNSDRHEKSRKREREHLVREERVKREPEKVEDGGDGRNSAEENRHRNRRNSPDFRETSKPGGSVDRESTSDQFPTKRKLYRPDQDDEMKEFERRQERKNDRSQNRNPRGTGAKFEWGKPDAQKPPLTGANADEPPQEVQKPNLGLSGKLAAETNTFNGVVIKYTEPSEARKPKVKWRLYPFKGEESLPILHVHRQSAYLIGRDRHITDIPVDHPSCSKQHAVLQYRSLRYSRGDGSQGRRTLPYLIDLGSANGTFLNGEKIDSARYYELHERDVIKFAFSSREYVILNENSLKNDESSDEFEGEGMEKKEELKEEA